MFLSTLRRAASLLALLASPLLSAAAASPEPPAKGLEFIENKGQWDARARYAAPLPAGRLFVEAAALTYSFVDPQQLRAHHSHGREGQAPSDKMKGHAYTMRFVGARAGASLQPTEPTGEVRNYLLGNDRRRWAQGVGGYRELRYQGLWSGIDAHLYENRQGQLEYDFELAPRADADRIRLRYEGTDGLRLRADGALEVLTSVGQVTELAPKAWQLDAQGRQQAVSCRYVLKDREVRFELGRYDHSRALIIDPTVLFSSFTGATADNWGFTATYDQQGNMYSGGIVFANGYPASPGAFDASYNGGIDIAIIKYNTAASGPAARAWATYLGGNSTDTPHSLVVNSQGDLIILGTTSSPNYPVNGHDQQFGGGPSFTPLSGISYPNGSDLVVTRLSGNGATLVGSTFLGGSSNDGLLMTTGSFNQLVHNYGDQFRGDVTVDADDNVYLTSSTSSQDFPTVGPVQASHRGGLFDAVVARFTPTLSNLTWASYFGGTGADAAYSIQLNAAREIYIAGGTTSPNLSFTASAQQGGLAGGVDGYILRLTPNASGTAYQAQRATYLGTGQHDEVYFLQVDEQGGVYALGQTRGTWPIVGNVYRNTNGRQFINKLAPDLGSVTLSTAFGTGRANPDISPTAFLVDQCERIYVCGWGGDINQGPYGNENTQGLPTTANAIQRNTDGNDFYLLQLSPYAASLEYATFFGGSNGEHVDGGTSRFDRRGFVYQAVCGGCGGLSNFPIPPGAGTFSNQNNATNCNNAAFKIDFSMNVAQAGPNQSLCADASAVRLLGTPAGGTWTGTGVTGSVAAGYSFTPAASLVGTHTLTYSVASTGTCVTTSSLTMTVRPVAPVAFTPVPQSCSNSSGTIPLTATPAGGTFSGPGVSGQNFSPSAAGPGNHTLTYTLPAGQCGQSSVVARVLPPPTIVAGRDTALCAFQRAGYQLRGFSPAGGTWSGTGCTPGGFFTPPATSGPLFLTYTYTDANGCTQTAQRRVMMVPDDRTNNPLNLPTCPLKPRPAEGMPFYTGMAPFTHTFDHDLLFASSYQWDFGDPDSGADNVSTEQFPTHTYAKPGTYNIKLTAFYNSSCQSTTRFAPVYVGDPFIPNIITPNGDGQNDVFEQRLSCLPVAIKVFSRWGNKVYESKDYQNNWGGASNEQGDGQLPDGIYYYHLTDTEGRTAKGWLEIRH